MKNTDLYSFEHTIAAPLFEKSVYPWEILKEISAFISEISDTLDKEIFKEISPGVFAAKNAKIASSAYICAPAIIGEESEIRHCAYIRGNVIIGKRCVVGNSTEMKNSIIFDNVQIPHYNYVGDSVIGYKSHLGAGAITSNVKSDKSPVSILYNGKRIETGQKKLGAMIGDAVEVGCGSVLCPGTVIGKNTTVYPLLRVRGFVPENSILKSDDNITEKRK